MLESTTSASTDTGLTSNETTLSNRPESNDSAKGFTHYVEHSVILDVPVDCDSSEMPIQHFISNSRKAFLLRVVGTLENQTEQKPDNNNTAERRDFVEVLDVTTGRKTLGFLQSPPNHYYLPQIGK